MSALRPYLAAAGLAAAGLASLLGPAQAPADVPVTAESLYREACLGCHDSEVYTREDRKVQSFEALARQVRRCECAMGLRWFDEDIGAVIDYLNDHFYRFPR